MKKLLSFVIFVLLVMPLTGQTHKTVDIVTPGTLTDALTAEEKTAITHLTVTGTIDSMDFITINESIPLLTVLDLTGCSTVNNAIYTDAFLYNYSLDTILLPPSITRIGGEAFLGCRFESITIPPAVELIEHSAFAYCRFKSISLPASLSIIEGSIFTWCDSLKTITVEEGNSAFCDVDGVLFNRDTTIILIYPQGRRGKYSIPTSVSEIAAAAFANCHFIDSLIIPTSLNLIGRLGLYGCRSLIDIAVDQDNEYFCDIGGVMFSKDSSVLVRYPSKRPGTHYDVPYGVIRLAENCFHFCSELLTVSLPYSLVDIDESAFRDCISITSLELPPSVKTIGIRAFNYCRAMQKIRIPSSVSFIGRYFLSVADELDTLMVNSPVPYTLDPTPYNFEMVDTNTCILLVPAGSAEAYRNATGWKSFVNIVEYEFHFEVSESALSFEAEGGTDTFTITSNTEWRIVSDSDWAAVSDTLGMDSKEITITITSNTAGGGRLGTLHLLPLGSDQVDISLTQAGSPVAISETEISPIRVYLANNLLHIEGARHYLLHVLSVDGRLWISKKLTEQEEILTTDRLPYGVYIVKATRGGKDPDSFSTLILK